MSAEADTPWVDLPSRILVVEDDPTIAALLKKTFQREAEVIVAQNGREGLAAIWRHSPDFVITDLMMPEMDGMEMMRQARKTSLGACLPIMVLTSKHDESVLLDCFRGGADDFMVKPFSVAELRVRVRSIFLRQQVARDANPLTKLPGNHVLKREIQERMRRPEAMAVAYIDLDHFKEFNDSHGFDRGDHVLQLVADILRGYAASRPINEVFVGHIGGDDFVTILPLENVEAMASYLFQEFTMATEPLFTPEEAKRGTYRSINRAGEEVEMPLPTISVGAVTNKREGMDDVRRVSQVAAEVKKMAKHIHGNSLFIDRRLA